MPHLVLTERLLLKELLMRGDSFQQTERFEDMIYLIYTSVASKPMSDEELVELLCQSKAWNQSVGITGLLLHREGLFMQLLEGPEEAVHDLFERIATDSRHHDVLKLLERPSRHRLFDDWAMAFQNIEQLTAEQKADKDYSGFSSFLSQPFSPQDLGTQFNEGLFLLLSFKKGTSPHDLR